MKIPATIVILLVLIYVALVLLMFPKWTVDDAYIVFRYAENLAHHGELSWNVGEDPVEGYTGIALPLLLTLAIKMGLEPDPACKFIGITSFILGGLCLLIVMRKLALRNIVPAVSILLYATAPFMFTHSLSGLETIMFGSALIACLLAFLLCLENKRFSLTRECAFWSLLLAASLIRPEGFVFGLSLAVSMVFIRYRQADGDFRRVLFCSVILFLLPFSIYFFWRCRYYGQLLPNAFYAKSYHGLINFDSVKRLLSFSLCYVLLPLLSCFMVFIVDIDQIWKKWKKGGIPQMNPRLLTAYTAVLVFVFIVLTQYMRSVLVMNFSHRFFVPFYPLFLVGIGILGALGLDALNASKKSNPLRYRVIKITLIIFLFLQLALHFRNLKREVAYVTWYKNLMEDAVVPAAEYLKRNVPSSEWLAVYLDAGAVPYFSGLRTVDLGKLNDEFLSGKKLSDDQIVDYLFSRNPAAVIFPSLNSDQVEYNNKVVTVDSNAIMNDPRFQRYKLVRRFGNHTKKEYYKFVYIRKDLLKHNE